MSASSIPVPGSPSGRGITELQRPLTDHDSIVRLAESGAHIYMIVGRSGHGKSQFLYALSRALDYAYGTGRPSGPPPSTPSDYYFGWHLQAPKVSFFFFDIAGEDFQNIVEFPKRSLLALLAHVLKHVQGIVLNIALHQHWLEANPTNPDDALAVCQTFLSYAVAAQSGRFKDADSLENAFHGSNLRDSVVHWPRLQIPVLINFSMADKYEMPPVIAPTVLCPDWGQGLPHTLPPHVVNPLGDDPAVLAALYMPQLYSFLRERVSWFKFAFTRAKTDDNNDNFEGCVEAFEFLVQTQWSGWLDSRFFHGIHFRDGRLKRFLGDVP